MILIKTFKDNKKNNPFYKLMLTNGSENGFALQFEHSSRNDKFGVLFFATDGTD
jgi:hypothetical protein